MKKVYVLSAMLLFVLLGWSQSANVSQQINIKYKNGNSVQIDAKDVDYIEFKETESNPDTPNQPDTPTQPDTPVNPNGDMAGRYLTFVAQESGTFKFNKNGINYSLDNGNTWTKLDAYESSPTVTAGQKIMWKGKLSVAPNGVGMFSSTSRFTVEGNIHSILWGDDFQGHIDLTGKSEAFHLLFADCTGLTSAENLVLSATTLTYGCYSEMFVGCTSLTTPPELPATTLAKACYTGMFEGCTSLTTAPELPATTLAEQCYDGMFYGCTSLRAAPSVLPATTLRYGCYGGMFYGCTSLQTAPQLPATILAIACYKQMFQNCTSLTTAPQLPAPTLADYCYANMFEGCTSLTTAPELPAKTLEFMCYLRMFYGCSSLNYIQCLATNISATNSNYSNFWVNGVSSTGTFVKNSSTTSWSRGENGIPSGWTVQNKQSTSDDSNNIINNNSDNDTSGNYLTFVALEDGKFWFSYDISYSPDSGNTWIRLASHTKSLTVQSGKKIMWKATKTPFPNPAVGIGTFSSTGRFEVEGNPHSLLWGDDFQGHTDLTGKSYAFARLFAGCTGLKSAENLVLPATTLAGCCYWGMFNGCTGLTTPPQLPATTLTPNCYHGMFAGCESLTKAPELPALNLASDCYYELFSGCTSLTKAPELPATTLAERCYYDMFFGCTSLTKAPELPATTLVSECYNNMFLGCTSLDYIKCLATDRSAADCTHNWVCEVSLTGTFVKNASSVNNWSRGQSGIPEGWTVQDDTTSGNDNNNNNSGNGDVADGYLTFVAEETGTFKFGGIRGNEGISYSLDEGSTWYTLARNTDSPTVSAGNKIMWKGLLTPLSSYEDGIGTFSSTGRFTVEGNIMSLLYGDDFQNKTSLSGKDFAFDGLFSSCTGLTSAENLVLPATTLAERCYYYMFRGCTSLTAAPSVLPATQLSFSCYEAMFYGCTSLTTAPELPATTLADYCYASMFEGCTNLLVAPTLPAPILVDGCYSRMFCNARNLCVIRCLATDISASNCTYDWVASNSAVWGDFYKAPGMSSWTKSSSGIPGSWTVHDYTP